jgi:hypothetical protein
MTAADASEALDRVEVDSTLQPALRLYRRLYLSRGDLEEAKATVDELLRARIPLPRSKPPSALLMSLTTALVVAYARPFVHSRGQSSFAEKTAPGSLLKVLSSTEREAHEYLLRVRNREVAHSDAESSEIYLKLHAHGDGAIFRVARSPFLRKELSTIRRMITKLETEVDRRCEELRAVLPHEVWM